MTLELSKSVIEGLTHLGGIINIDLSKKLILNAVKQALHSDANIPSIPEIYASKPDYAKQSEYAVVTLLFIATKFNYDSQRLLNFLEQHELHSVVVDELVKVYETHRKELLIKNLKVGHSLPHITDVEWKLTCDVKSSSLDSGPGELTYRINLGKYNEKTGDRESIVEFVCNVEELQCLVYKLKEIERHCERICGAGK